MSSGRATRSIAVGAGNRCLGTPLDRQHRWAPRALAELAASFLLEAVAWRSSDKLFFHGIKFLADGPSSAMSSSSSLVSTGPRAH